MNKCLLQLWEQSSITEHSSSGCSLHIDLKSYQNFISKIYNSRNGLETPDVYDRVVSGPIECFISDELFTTLMVDSDIRLTEVEKCNLSKFEDIIIKS